MSCPHVCPHEDKRQWIPEIIVFCGREGVFDSHRLHSYMSPEIQQRRGFPGFSMPQKSVPPGVKSVPPPGEGTHWDSLQFLSPDGL